MKTAKTPRLLHAALLGGAVVALLSCTEPARPGGARHDLTAPPQPVGPLVQSLLPWCAPRPYDSVTVTVGPRGGIVSVGANTLVFLPNSLDSAVTVTAVAPSDTVSRVRLQPEGLKFHQPVLLVMSYATCNLLGSTHPLNVAYTTPDLRQVLDYLPSMDDSGSQTVTGRLKHFSDYAVAW